MPLIISIYSNEYDKYGNEIAGSLKGLSCFQQVDDYNLIYTVSKDSFNTLPDMLIDQNFLARFININFRGEILSFSEVPVFIDYNIKTKNFKITINIKKNY
ncbi:hypothetical protein DICPUDRAFT_74006 [Dictyostelium purpureum]|uniref:Uncharacterized protein n=1 Tax=Dictyostelium purpureum TaxID=5786 RepID=F0Z6H7_DICPU|nr:uncharacterized protein DICPUDRAFT_74006 [Dictyostelium purpureum]EGC40442.1 hypothetical protein DICPUDRAFT_74006 [Dictyostelium purpureum]|eukprot:XP_003282989.1 hypothetical protein DICPUDRAFT_74006 [Dictyostelium purpureum]